jgi:hypothetical protein
MDDPRRKINPNERNCLTLEEAVPILWEWRRYRNEVFYSSVYRWGAAALFITLAPYLIPDIITKLGLAVLIFPVLAFLLSGFAAYLTAVQYKLYKLTDHKFRSLLGPYKPDDPPYRNPVDRIFRIPLGLSIAALFACFAVFCQLVNGIILFNLAQNAIH